MNGDGNVACAIAAEQYQFWKTQGMTLREMVTVAERVWRSEMTGDDVIIELAASWNALINQGEYDDTQEIT
jgi:hypothetical protein